jgi:hypothetical protein
MKYTHELPKQPTTRKKIQQPLKTQALKPKTNGRPQPYTMCSLPFLRWEDALEPP